MSERERSIVIGGVLGDGCLQKTGERNARLRLEHGEKQRAYIFWKWTELKRYMQAEPKRMVRFNPIWRKRYAYYRCQSHASPQLGKFHSMFYTDHRKRIIPTIGKFLNPLALAVWFMDDGYYYGRDRVAYVYLSKLTSSDIENLRHAFAENFNLHPRVERKKTGAINLKFTALETKELVRIIAPHVIPSMRYKIGEEPRID